MIFGIFEISGHSMFPHFSPHEKVAASSFPYLFRRPKVGDIVLFLKDKKVIVKRIIEIDNKRIRVAGDNVKDSFFNIEIKKEVIIAKVLFKI